MDQLPSVGPPLDDDEIRRLQAVMDESYGCATSESDTVEKRMGRENLRVVRRDGAVVGGLVLIPVKQIYGGSPVSMVGVASVAVAPDQRRRGTASELMRGVIKEMFAADVALSTLYPAIFSLYRNAQYEPAGLHPMATAPLRLLDGELEGELRAIEDKDQEEIRACYARWARQRHGAVLRNEPLWRCLVEDAKGYAVRENGRLTGYAYVTTSRSGAGDVYVRDLVAETAGALQTLRLHLGGYGTVFANLRLPCASLADPALLDLPSGQCEMTVKTPWMLRVVNVQRALTQRGYPSGVNAELHLEIDDELIPENCGRWVLNVADGCGVVTRGGEGLLQTSVRALAPLYSGYMNPREAVLVGQASGSQAALDIAATIFGGGPPCMRDAF